MKKEITLNRVEGFDPKSRMVIATDSEGRPWLDENGEPHQYLPTNVKVLWFRKLYPEGRFVTQRIESDWGTIRYRAAVYLREDSQYPVSVAEYETLRPTQLSPDGFATACQSCQTKALGKALTRAGFGCEFEFTPDEPEPEPVITEKADEPKKGKAKAKKKDTPTTEPEEVQEKPEPEPESEPESKEGNIDEFIDSLLSDDDAGEEDEATHEAEEAAEADSEPDFGMQDALDTVVELTDKANFAMLRFEGKTIREIIKNNPDFCELVLRPNVGEQVTDEVIKAASVIVEG